MNPYDNVLFSPSAPVAEVRLISPNDPTKISTVRLQIDTGADVTLLPLSVIRAMGLSPLSNITFALTTFDGEVRQAEAVRVHLKFEKYLFRGEYLLTEEPMGILGRDVLNSLRLVLDGPRLLWEIS